MKESEEPSPWQLLPSEFSKWLIHESKIFRQVLKTADMDWMPFGVAYHNALAEIMYNQMLGLDTTSDVLKEGEDDLKQFYIKVGMAEGEQSVQEKFEAFKKEARTVLRKLTGTSRGINE